MRRPEPKSYLPASERESLLREGGSMNLVYLAESEAADDAGDEAAAYAWMAKVPLAAHTLLGMKENHGAQFIRDYGFITARADEAYGPDWLNSITQMSK